MRIKGVAEVSVEREMSLFEGAKTCQSFHRSLMIKSPVFTELLPKAVKSITEK